MSKQLDGDGRAGRVDDPGARGTAPAGDVKEATATPVDSAALFGARVDCQEAVHELYHYLDGELTETRRHEIRVHLDWCGPCSGAADFEAELRKVIANRCKDRVPQSLIERVAAAIDEESRHPHDN